LDTVLARHLASESCKAALVAVLVIGCQPVRVERPAAAVEQVVAADSAPYRLDATASELHILVFRDGPFARFGHNHVVAARGLEGSAAIYAPDDVSFEMLIDVRRLDVDPTDLRERYGEAFSTTPGESDIAATRENMLGAALLDAQAYPYIRIAGRIRDQRRIADVEIAIKDSTATVTLPVAVAITGDLARVEGALELDHAAIGLTPFSVMLGALRVAETMEIRFSIVARRAATS